MSKCCSRATATALSPFIDSTGAVPLVQPEPAPVDAMQVMAASVQQMLASMQQSLGVALVAE